MASADDTADLPPTLLEQPIDPEDNGYAYGGVTVMRGAYPWQAQIYSTSPLAAYTPAERAGREAWEMPHRCGGTVIARNWILTAAHCVKPDSIKAGRRVRLNVTDLSRDKGVTFAITEVVTHPAYKNSFRRNDIALIRFRAADGESGRGAAAAIRPLAALDRGMMMSERMQVFAMGWGKTRNVRNFQTSSALLLVDLRVVPQPECQRLWVSQEVPEGIGLCAAASGKATCAGDSGGPVFTDLSRPVLVGVVAGGNKFCTGDRMVPGIYTRVAAFQNWIDCVIANRGSVCERLGLGRQIG